MVVAKKHAVIGNASVAKRRHDDGIRINNGSIAIDRAGEIAFALELGAWRISRRRGNPVGREAVLDRKLARAQVISAAGRLDVDNR